MAISKNSTSPEYRITANILIYQIQKRLTNLVQILLFALIFFSLQQSYSQEPVKKDSVIITPVVDSLFVDKDLRNWSIRLYGISKAQNFFLSNDDIKLEYTPNNLYGIGIGIATSKLILDFSINLKDSSTENTDRFDMQGSYLANEHYFDFYLQVYDGFNIENSENDSSIFRDDIKSVAIGTDYLYLFNGTDFDEMMLLSGLKKQKRTLFTLGAGGFLLYNRISADESIVPDEFMNDFNEEAQLTRFTDYGLGALGGFTGVLNISQHWYGVITGKLGIGLMVKKAETESLSYKPGNPVVYKFNVAATFGYAKNRFYSYFNVGTGSLITDLDFGNDGRFSLLKAKWVFGYRFFKNKK